MVNSVANSATGLNQSGAPDTASLDTIGVNQKFLLSGIGCGGGGGGNIGCGGGGNSTLGAIVAVLGICSTVLVGGGGGTKVLAFG